MNGLEALATAEHENANVLLHRSPYDIVDLDPFGSPVPYLDAASQSAKKLLLVTATDTAPLCGAHTGGLRNYGARPLNTEYPAELSTRMLLDAVARELAKHDKAVKPLLSYASAHFVRLIVQVERGTEKCARIKVCVIDVWGPYIASVHANTTAEIVYDLFYVAQKITDAVDEVRKQESAKADAVTRKKFKKKRFLILKRRKRLDQWFQNVKEAGLAPFAAVAKITESYLDGILNYFSYRLSNAASEGFNSTPRLTSASGERMGFTISTSSS